MGVKGREKADTKSWKKAFKPKQDGEKKERHSTKGRDFPSFGGSAAKGGIGGKGNWGGVEDELRVEDDVHRDFELGQDEAVSERVPLDFRFSEAFHSPFAMDEDEHEDEQHSGGHFGSMLPTSMSERQVKPVSHALRDRAPRLSISSSFERDSDEEVIHDDVESVTLLPPCSVSEFELDVGVGSPKLPTLAQSPSHLPRTPEFEVSSSTAVAANEEKGEVGVVESGESGAKQEEKKGDSPDKEDGKKRKGLLGQLMQDRQEESGNKGKEEKDKVEVDSNSLAKGASKPLVKFSDFEILKVVGRGAFGKVFTARIKNSPVDGKVYAMKSIRKAVATNEKKVKGLQQERELLVRVRHPFIVQLYLAFQSRTKLYLLMDYINGGQLFYHMREEGLFLEKHSAFYLGELVLAVGHLHSVGIIHRDLKPENVLLQEDGHLILTDFGCSREALGDDRATSLVGTDAYMAPEILKGEGYDRRVDWWAIGVLAFHMMTGTLPFFHRNAKKMHDLITLSKPKFPSYLSSAAISLLRGLLTKDPAKRLGSKGVDEIKSHKFFKGIKFDALLNKQVAPPLIPKTADGKEDVSNFDPKYTAEPAVDTPVQTPTLHNEFSDYSYAAPSFLDHHGHPWRGRTASGSPRSVERQWGGVPASMSPKRPAIPEERAVEEEEVQRPPNAVSDFPPLPLSAKSTSEGGSESERRERMSGGLFGREVEKEEGTGSTPVAVEPSTAQRERSWANVLKSRSEELQEEGEGQSERKNADGTATSEGKVEEASAGVSSHRLAQSDVSNKSALTTPAVQLRSDGENGSERVQKGEEGGGDAMNSEKSGVEEEKTEEVKRAVEVVVEESSAVEEGASWEELAESLSTASMREEKKGEKKEAEEGKRTEDAPPSTSSASPSEVKSDANVLAASQKSAVEVKSDANVMAASRKPGAGMGWGSIVKAGAVETNQRKAIAPVRQEPSPSPPPKQQPEVVDEWTVVTKKKGKRR